MKTWFWAFFLTFGFPSLSLAVPQDVAGVDDSVSSPLGNKPRVGVKFLYPPYESFNFQGPPYIKVCLKGSDNECTSDTGKDGCSFHVSVKKGAEIVWGKDVPESKEERNFLSEMEFFPSAWFWSKKKTPWLPVGTYDAHVKVECTSPSDEYEESISFRVSALAGGMPELSFTRIRPVAAASADRTAVMSIVASEDQQFSCQLITPEYVSTYRCNGKREEFSGLTEGVHGFSAYALNGNSHASSPYFTDEWRVTRLATNFTDGPKALTEKTEATFSFNAPDSGDYKCALHRPGVTEPAEFMSCASGVTYSTHQDGKYVLLVRATDLFFNVEEPPALYTWVVDASPPEVEVRFPLKGKAVNTLTPVFKGVVDDSDSMVRVIVLNSGGVEASKRAEGRNWSVALPAGLQEKKYTAEIRSVNNLGLENVGSWEFAVDITAPMAEILTGPEKKSRSGFAAFSFKANEPKSTFMCQVEPVIEGFGAPSECSESQVFSGFKDGEHLLKVFARDEAGNDGPPVMYRWTVSIIPPPAPEVLSPADGAIVDTSTPVISGRAGPFFMVMIYVDGAKVGSAPANAQGEWTFRMPAPLGEGEHRINAEAIDDVGNVSAQRSVEQSFTIFVAPEKSSVIGGGLGCSAFGMNSPSAWLLLSGVAWSAWRQRRNRWQN